MDYKLAKKLKDAGMVLENGWDFLSLGEPFSRPTLSELIAACGDDFYELKKVTKAATITSDWFAVSMTQGIYSGICSTPEIAVANLWLALNNKPTV